MDPNMEVRTQMSSSLVLALGATIYGLGNFGNKFISMILWEETEVPKYFVI